MSTLRFNDGVEIDTSGEYRTLQLHDGWYVVGHGSLVPCADYAEAVSVRDEMVATSTKKAVPSATTPNDQEPPDSSEPKFPDVHVQLTGEDGNVFSIIGRVQRALRQGGASNEDVDAFWAEVSSARAYEEALLIVSRWIDVS